MKTAHAQGSGSSPEGSAYFGVATVGLGATGPFLAAAVQGSAPSDRIKYAPWRTGGTASASIYDEIQITGEVPAGEMKAGQEIQAAEVTFEPSVSGTLKGNAQATFTLTVGLAGDNWRMVRDEESWDPQWATWKDPSGHRLTMQGPAAVVVQLMFRTEYDSLDDAYSISTDPISLYMRLAVNATAYPGFMSSSAEFQHTAILNALRVSNTNGATIPWAKYLRVRSLNGATYQLASPAGPAALSIIAVGGGPLDGGFTLTWNSVSNTTYRVQKTLQPGGSWADIGQPITASALTTTFTDTNLLTGSNAAFYRVRINP